MQSVPGPGWYTDPWHHASARWWDGQQWTGHTQQPHTASIATDPELRHARTDVRGGGIALFGFIGANALSACGALFAIAVLGVPARSVTAELFALAGFWTGIACTVYMVTRRMNATIADLGFAWPTAGEFGMGFGFAFLAAIAASRVALFLRAFLSDDSSPKSNLFLSHRPSAAAIFVLAAAACIGAPIFEELFFRGIVQGIFTRRSGATTAIVVQAALFGCAHFQLGMTANEAIIRIVTIGVVGLFLGWLRNHTGRLGAGMVMHGTYNLIVVLVTIAVLSSH